MHDLDLPRLAIYSLWSGNATQDVGWVRYALDKFEVPYDLIYKERVKKGDLKSCLRRHRDAEPGRQRQAHGVRHREARRSRSNTRRATRSRTSGMYGESDDITGGMGLEGVAEFEKFVKAGGLLVTLGQASYFPAEFGLAPKVDAARTSRSSTRRARSSTRRSCSRSTRFSTATTRR